MCNLVECKVVGGLQGVHYCEYVCILYYVYVYRNAYIYIYMCMCVGVCITSRWSAELWGVCREFITVSMCVYYIMCMCTETLIYIYIYIYIYMCMCVGVCITARSTIPMYGDIWVHVDISGFVGSVSRYLYMIYMGVFSYQFRLRLRLMFDSDSALC